MLGKVIESVVVAVAVASTVVAALSILVGVVVGYPLAVLWAANVFGAGVPYTWRTSVAVLVLISAVRGFRWPNSR